MNSSLAPVCSGPDFSRCLNYGMALGMAVVTMGGNLLIMVASLWSHELRKKETFVILGLAVADGLTGLGRFLLYQMRLGLIVDRRTREPTSARDCITFATVIMTFSLQFQGWMMVGVNGDRLFAVFDPLRYLGLPKSYPMFLTGGVLGYNVLLIVLGLYLSTFMSDVKIYTPVCLTDWLFPKPYTVYLDSCRLFTGYMSVCLYLFTYYIYRRKNMDSLSQLATQAQKRSLEKQRELTKVFGIVTLCTMLFHNIPYSLLFLASFLDLDRAVFSKVATYLYMTASFNTACNILIYVWRYPDLRHAMKAVLCCHQVARVAPTVVSTRNNASAATGKNTAHGPTFVRRGTGVQGKPIKVAAVAEHSL